MVHVATMTKQRKESSPRSPRGDRRPRSTTSAEQPTEGRHLGSAATVADELAKVLGTTNPVDQAAILNEWITKWRLGEIEGPLAARRARSFRSARAEIAQQRYYKRQQRAAIVSFLTWKLGRSDLAAEASRILRRIEKRVERSLACWPLPTKDGATVVGLRQPPPGANDSLLARVVASVEAERAITAGRGSDLSGEAWVSFLWRMTWNLTMALSPTDSYERPLGNKIRRRLLKIPRAIEDNPISASHRLFAINVLLLRGVYAAGAHPARTWAFGLVAVMLWVFSDYVLGSKSPDGPRKLGLLFELSRQVMDKDTLTLRKECEPYVRGVLRVLDGVDDFQNLPVNEVRPSARRLLDDVRNTILAEPLKEQPAHREFRAFIAAEISKLKNTTRGCEALCRRT